MTTPVLTARTRIYRICAFVSGIAGPWVYVQPVPPWRRGAAAIPAGMHLSGTVSEAIGRVMALARPCWIGFGHVEAAERGR